MNDPVKTAVAVVLFAISFVVSWKVTSRWRRSRLSRGERQIRDLVRETYKGNITSEQIVRQGRDAMFSVKLKSEKVEDLRINISSLSRKHKEGASLVALKAAMRFDDVAPSAAPPPSAGLPAHRVE